MPNGDHLRSTLPLHFQSDRQWCGARPRLEAAAPAFVAEDLEAAARLLDGAIAILAAPKHGPIGSITNEPQDEVVKSARLHRCHSSIAFAG